MNIVNIKRKVYHISFLKSNIFDINRKLTSCLVLSILFVACVIFSYLTVVMPGRSYIAIWLNDVMGLIDVANRIHIGEVPYKDFHWPYGLAVALIPGVGLNLGLSAGAIFGFNATVVGGLLLMTAVISLPRRLPLLAASLVFVFVWLLIVVPMGETQHFTAVSWGYSIIDRAGQRLFLFCCSTLNPNKLNTMTSGGTSLQFSYWCYSRSS